MLLHNELDHALCGGKKMMMWKAFGLALTLTVVSVILASEFNGGLAPF